MKGLKFPPLMNTATVWVVWLFLAVGALGWALFVLLDAFDAKKDAAAWVQAVGSVLAIIVAIAVASSQNQRAYQTAKQEERELLNKLCVVANFVAEVSNNASSYLSDNAGDKRMVSRFEISLRDCDYLMREVQFNEVPRAEAAVGWLELRAAVRDVLHGVQTIQEGKRGGVSMLVIYDMEAGAIAAENARCRINAACAG
ncbi:hypothetical protein NYP20_13735 [Pseudomonas sp. N3-W]|uniref:hypothetical protein n=1 Tax=Pseudomonas sp. N3-W TaxID=2975049 RepID=UPI00217D3FE9|nr:hypothetical protein [Pseudomonas sp. N3-W]UWF51961.1 hypothetical protein NYP20_13735 [Pseudomonas sp. N3-W]